MPLPQNFMFVKSDTRIVVKINEQNALTLRQSGFSWRVFSVGILYIYIDRFIYFFENKHKMPIFNSYLITYSHFTLTK